MPQTQGHLRHCSWSRPEPSWKLNRTGNILYFAWKGQITPTNTIKFDNLLWKLNYAATIYNTNTWRVIQHCAGNIKLESRWYLKIVIWQTYGLKYCRQLSMGFYHVKFCFELKFWKCKKFWDTTKLYKWNTTGIARIKLIKKRICYQCGSNKGGHKKNWNNW